MLYRLKVQCVLYSKPSPGDVRAHAALDGESGPREGGGAGQALKEGHVQVQAPPAYGLQLVALGLGAQLLVVPYQDQVLCGAAERCQHVCLKHLPRLLHDNNLQQAAGQGDSGECNGDARSTGCGRLSVAVL